MYFILSELLPAILIGFFFMLGVLGAFLPIIPASLVVWLGIFIHKVWLGEASVSWYFFWVATALAVLSQVLDWLCTYWGARRFGASWYGGVGAVLGVLLGPFLLTPFIGLVVGPIVGTITAEILSGKRLKLATKAGFGTLIGGFLAFVLKLVIVCFIVVGFFYNMKMKSIN